VITVCVQLLSDKYKRPVGASVK